MARFGTTKSLKSRSSFIISSLFFWVCLSSFQGTGMRWFLLQHCKCNFIKVGLLRCLSDLTRELVAFAETTTPLPKAVPNYTHGYKPMWTSPKGETLPLRYRYFFRMFRQYYCRSVGYHMQKLCSGKCSQKKPGANLSSCGEKENGIEKPF